MDRAWKHDGEPRQGLQQTGNVALPTSKKHQYYWQRCKFPFENDDTHLEINFLAIFERFLIQFRSIFDDFLTFLGFSPTNSIATQLETNFWLNFRQFMANFWLFRNISVIIDESDAKISIWKYWNSFGNQFLEFLRDFGLNFGQFLMIF